MVLKVKKKTHEKASIKTALSDFYIIILKAPFLYPKKNRFDQIVHLTRSSDILSLRYSLLVILIIQPPSSLKLEM